MTGKSRASRGNLVEALLDEELTAEAEQDALVRLLEDDEAWGQALADELEVLESHARGEGSAGRRAAVERMIEADPRIRVAARTTELLEELADDVRGGPAPEPAWMDLDADQIGAESSLISNRESWMESVWEFFRVVRERALRLFRQA